MIIDRFEGGYAIVEMADGKYIDIPKSELPKNAKEGDCLSLVIDKQKNDERKSKMKKLINEIWED